MNPFMPPIATMAPHQMLPQAMRPAPLRAYLMGQELMGTALERVLANVFGGLGQQMCVCVCPPVKDGRSR